MLGFGRIGQLVAQRALGFGMHVVAFDAYVAEERFREVGVERAESSDELYAEADFITIHLPVTRRDPRLARRRGLRAMKDGVRVINVARGGLLVDADLQAALDSGKVAGAALDVFREEPVTEHPLFGYPNVVVTPHLGASTSRGHRPRRLPGGGAGGGRAHRRRRHLRREHPRDSGRGHGGARRLPAARARPRADRHALAEGTSVDALEVEYRGRIAERDTRLLTVQVLKGALAGHTEEEVNDVNAPAHRAGARHRGRPRRAPPRRATSPTSCG